MRPASLFELVRGRRPEQDAIPSQDVTACPPKKLDLRRRRRTKRTAQISTNVTAETRARAEWLLEYHDCSMADLLEEARGVMKCEMNARTAPTAKSTPIFVTFEKTSKTD